MQGINVHATSSEAVECNIAISMMGRTCIADTASLDFKNINLKNYFMGRP
jgi:hypothetical protein